MNINDLLSTYRNAISRKEHLVFYLFVFIQIIPLVLVDRILTVDGPAHVYNARLMAELWSDPNSPIHEYLGFNQISPNWSGHLLLIGLSKLMSWSAAEKVLILSVVVGLPVSFRYLLRALNGRIWASYLILPFAHSYFLYFGFYNFMIALVLFFFMLGVWIKTDHKRSFNYLILFLGATTLCLSHLFVFCAFCVSVALFELSYTIHDWHKIQWWDWIKRNIGHLLALSGGLALTVNFFFGGDKVEGTPKYDSLTQLGKAFVEVLPAKAMSYGKEGNLLLPFGILLSIAGLAALITVIRKIVIKHEIHQNALFGLFSTIAFATLYLILPKGDGISYGFITSRILLILFCFLFVFLSTIEFPRISYSILVISASYISTSSLFIYFQKQTEFNTDMNSLLEVAPYIEENSTVYPFIQSAKPFHGHFSNILGTEKELILLENYEAHLTYFPLKWNTRMPQLHIAGLEATEQCIKIPKWKQGPKQLVDFVVIFNSENPKYSTECELLLKKHIHSGYALLKKSEDGLVELYKKN